MPLFGHIGEFDESDKSAWEEWCDRMEQYFLANKLEDSTVKRAIFLSSVGAATYSTLASLCSPKKPKELSFTELLKLLQEHNAPKPSTDSPRCFRCLSTRHTSRNCPMRNKICFECKKRGHTRAAHQAGSVFVVESEATSAVSQVSGSTMLSV
ncbi:hypothetical protein E2C01_042395 [Portunus trituberculatus]|uniref:CCHC-type domain-containing protein n=1 Tax=Portunus trituberculatus TaxID=210409 RepID=A0A5B7FTI7_PORTR|nr:hypothetical protein [Portunus trituberculatus]